jgi:hypothetical protein
MMDDVRCPKCGRRTTIRTARKDDCQYHVCINYPRCRGRVPVDEVWGDDWDKARPATKTTYDSTRQRVTPYPPRRGAEKAIRTAKKDSRNVRAGVKRPEREGRVSFDKGWGDDWSSNWGDDWDKEIPPAPKPAPSLPQYPRAQKREVAPEKKEPPKPWQQITLKKEAAPEKKEPPKPQQQVVSTKDVCPEKKEPAKPRPQIAPKKEVSLKEKKPSRPWWRRAPKKEAAPEKKEPSKPRQQITLKKEVATEKKGPPKPRQRIAPKADTAPEVKAPPKLRQRRVPQRYLVPEKKKRSTTVIIIALIVAFLAIDGMIYAAFVLR